MIEFCSFLCLSYSLMYIYTTSSLSCLDRHLGCFYVLAIENNPAVNTEVNVFFCIMVFCGYMPSSGISGLYVGSMFSFVFFFLCTSIAFFIVAVSIYIPTSSVRGFWFFSTPFPAFIVCRSFDDGYSEMIPHSFDLHFSKN